MPGLAPRRAALHLLHAVTVLGRPLDGQLDRALAGLSASDRGLARALTGGALRHLMGLDALIARAAAESFGLDPERLGRQLFAQGAVAQPLREPLLRG